jgi:hypothetical protein
MHSEFESARAKTRNAAISWLKGSLYSAERDLEAVQRDAKEITIEIEAPKQPPATPDELMALFLGEA